MREWEREKSEKIDCHQQDSNQGPSLEASDALTSELWCSCHPSRDRSTISPDFVTALKVRADFLELAELRVLLTYALQQAIMTITAEHATSTVIALSTTTTTTTIEIEHSSAIGITGHTGVIEIGHTATIDTGQFVDIETGRIVIIVCIETAHATTIEIDHTFVEYFHLLCVHLLRADLRLALTHCTLTLCKWCPVH